MARRVLHREARAISPTITSIAAAGSGTAALLPAPAGVAEGCGPDIVVGLVDHGVVVAVGGGVAIAPQHVVGRIDDAVSVVIARERPPARP